MIALLEENQANKNHVQSQENEKTSEVGLVLLELTLKYVNIFYQCFVANSEHVFCLPEKAFLLPDFKEFI